ncbi:hypothetical protein MTR_2g043970 [Medicago truncatula]|uniref:Uncharacterized protein n=1 Tax=Medicago truncatula TaxID=3880 RepID=A0A072V7N6_MEDTR|nr:hypothetical protein MTR_2g043970 [Medicago truncatula]
MTKEKLSSDSKIRKSKRSFWKRKIGHARIAYSEKSNSLSKMVSKPTPRSVGSPAIRFLLSGHSSFMPTNQAQ